jgi:membrane-bound lytic murein transglycosylase D
LPVNAYLSKRDSTWEVDPGWRPVVKALKLLSMSFPNRLRFLGLLLLCLAALGFPTAAGAEPEELSPEGSASAPPVQGRAVDSPQGESILTLGEDPTEPGSGSDLQTSDGTGTESFSPRAPLFPIRDNPEVRHFLEWFQSGSRRPIVERWLERSGRYADMIQGVLRDKGLPEDLMFTAMIESGFNPIAVSRAGAKGLWQFMTPTARRYGLRVDRWVDERLDPEKSTVAAARYLGDLHALFGSWELAKAGYNAGEMKVLRAIKLFGTSDFWELTRGRFLRDETKNFVPAIQAATLIGREPERYGFTASQTEPLVYEVAPVPSGLSLSRVAVAAGVDLDILCDLNPELRMKQTPPGGSYLLKFPVGASERFVEGQQRERAHRLAAAGRGRHADKPRIHIVQSKETVGSIARRYGISAAELVRWNELDGGARIRPGDRLRIVAAAPAD